MMEVTGRKGNPKLFQMRGEGPLQFLGIYEPSLCTLKQNNLVVGVNNG